MNQLKTVDEVPTGTKVLLKLDTDLPMDGGQITDNSRLLKSEGVIRKLLAKNCKIIIGGKRGRPNGKVDLNLSLRPVYLELMTILGEISGVFVDDVLDIAKIDVAVDNNSVVVLENLRFWPGEEKNDGDFAKYLSGLAEVLVNDAIAMAHREEASVCLHRLMPTYYGDNFIAEVEMMEKVRSQSQKPLILVLGGAKEDKLEHLGELLKIADKVLIGGRLPKYKEGLVDPKIVWGELAEDGLDINLATMTQFSQIISEAKTVVWAGAMGYFEDREHQEGTNKIAEAVANCGGYKVIAGGDTGVAVRKLSLEGKIDFVSSGGGVLLQYLAKGTLAAIE